MTPTPPTFAQTHAADRTFILRLTWNEGADSWSIQLKPVNGEAARLFSDSETLLHYLETVMRARRAPATQSSE